MRQKDFDQGFGNAIQEIIGGIVVSLFINAISATGFVPSDYMLMIELINIIALVSLLFSLQKAGVAYIVGWIFGIYIMIQSGLMNFLDIILYLVVPIAIIGIRVYFWIKET